MFFFSRAAWSRHLLTTGMFFALLAIAQSPKATLTQDNAPARTDGFLEYVISDGVGSSGDDSPPMTAPQTNAVLPAPVLAAGENVLLVSYLRAPDPSDAAGLRTMAENFDLLVLHEWHGPKIPTFRFYNPDIVVMLYKTRGLMLTDSQEGVANYHTVKQYDFAFMHDHSGNHVFWDWDFDGTLEAASPRPELVAFQNFFYDRALASVSDGGFDGLMIDDVWSTEFVQGTPDIAEYSNADDFEAVRVAMEEFLVAGYDRTRTTGQLIGGNIGWWQQITADGSRVGRVYMEQMDVALQEKFFVNYTTHWNTGEDWYTEILALIDDMRDTGRTIICNSRSFTDDRETMLYALGSYLCLTDRDGRAALSFFDHYSSSRIPPLFPEYETAENLGAPLDDVKWYAGRQVGYRRFENGYVVVNPNSSSRTITELSGYDDVYGNPVPGSGYTIPAFSAMLFF